ncbi:MAG: ABC transporter permease [Nitrospiraceae bacterium]|nr:ABC transporter permease [Nitrospiraceae bacterium]
MNGFRILLQHRRLIWHLVLLDFRVRYAGSRLGLAWMLLGPALILCSYLVVFGSILRVQPNPGLSAVDYAVLVTCGLLPWLGFSEGITGGTNSVLAHRNLMKGQLFPMELIPVTAVCSGMAGQLIGTSILLLVMGLRGHLGVSLIWLPGLLAAQAVFTIGLVWVLSCINILIRDLSQILRLAMVLLMFISPIAYTSQMVPHGLDWAIGLNPLSIVIDGYRDVVLFGKHPQFVGLAAFGAVAILLFHLGYDYFMRLKRTLPDLL